MIDRARQHGVTRVEVSIVITCIALGVAAITLLPSMPDERIDARKLADSSIVNQLTKSVVLSATNFQGRFFMPSLVNRLSTQGQEVAGEGPEDKLQNHSAALYAAMIAQQYFNPDLLVSHRERNPNVKVMKDYNFNAYNPATDCYWDRSFKADLDHLSHVSFAHMPLLGERAATQWRDTVGEEVVLFGTRGPGSGVASKGLYSCEKDGTWDGAYSNRSSMTRESFPGGGPTVMFGTRDNLFTSDRGLESLDAWLTISSGVERDGDGFKLLLEWD